MEDVVKVHCKSSATSKNLDPGTPFFLDAIVLYNICRSAFIQVCYLFRREPRIGALYVELTLIDFKFFVTADV